MDEILPRASGLSARKFLLPKEAKVAVSFQGVPWSTTLTELPTPGVQSGISVAPKGISIAFAGVSSAQRTAAGDSYTSHVRVIQGSILADPIITPASSNHQMSSARVTPRMWKATGSDDANTKSSPSIPGGKVAMDWSPVVCSTRDSANHTVSVRSPTRTKVERDGWSSSMASADLPAEQALDTDTASKSATSHRISKHGIHSRGTDLFSCLLNACSIAANSTSCPNRQCSTRPPQARRRSKSTCTSTLKAVDRLEFAKEVVADWSRLRGDQSLSCLASTQRLIWSGRVVEAALERVVRKVGFKDRSDYEIAAVVRRSEPRNPTVAEVARSLLLKPSGMTGRIDRLERQGFLVRVADRSDRRAQRLHLTPNGTAAVDATFTDNVALYEQIFRSLSSEERSTLDQLLEEVLESLDSLSLEGKQRSSGTDSQS